MAATRSRLLVEVVLKHFFLAATAKDLRAAALHASFLVLSALILSTAVK